MSNGYASGFLAEQRHKHRALELKEDAGSHRSETAQE